MPRCASYSSDFVQYLHVMLCNFMLVIRSVYPVLPQIQPETVLVNCGNLRELAIVCCRFPMSQPERVRVWEHAMHRENFRASRWSCVCSTHFTPDCFNRTGQTVRLREGESICYLLYFAKSVSNYSLLMQTWCSLVHNWLNSFAVTRSELTG